MYSKSRAILDGVCYHILTRGDQKQRVFTQDKDYEEYLEKEI